MKTARRVSFCAHVLGDSISLTSACRLLVSAGIGEIELLGEPDKLRPREMAGVLDGHGITVSALTAASRLPTGRDPASPRARVRKSTIDHYRRCIDLAVLLKCPLVGVAPSAVGRHWLLAAANDELAYSKATVREIAAYAAAAGVRIGLEVLCRYASCHVNTGAQAKRYLAGLQQDNVSVVFDLFHMNIEESSIPAAIRDLAGSIGNVHVADSNRRGIGHGHLDIGAIVNALRSSGYRGPMTFESFPTQSTGDAPYSAAETRLLRLYAREFVPRLRHYGW
jgi:D-psicose/D-tagatose/L-ribulose 3-epimerase